MAHKVTWRHWETRRPFKAGDHEIRRRWVLTGTSFPREVCMKKPSTEFTRLGLLSGGRDTKAFVSDGHVVLSMPQIQGLFTFAPKSPLPRLS